MNKIIVAAIIALCPSAAFAGDCNVYVDASVTGTGGATIDQADYLHFTMTMWGTELKCSFVDDKQPHGPYAGVCKQAGEKPRKEWVNYFKGPNANSQPTMLFGNEIWYSSCDTDIKAAN